MLLSSEPDPRLVHLIGIKESLGTFRFAAWLTRESNCRLMVAKPVAKPVANIGELERTVTVGDVALAPQFGFIQDVSER